MEGLCYVYAIVHRGMSIRAELKGLNEAPLSAVAWQDLAAVVSRIESAAILPKPVYLLRHEAVVETMCQAGSALPVRFGTVLSDPEAVAQALARKYQVLLADLARVGDKVELGLTILWNTTAEQDEAKAGQPVLWPAETSARGTPGAGTRYLQARLAEYRREATQQHRARSLLAHLEEALHVHTLEQHYDKLSTRRLAVRAAYLVHPWQVQGFQQAVDEIRQQYPTLRWLVSGPWPPYTFVTLRTP